MNKLNLKIAHNIRRKPLLLQLGLAAAALAQPELALGENFSNDYWQTEKSLKLRRSMEQVLKGLAKYQNYEWRRSTSPRTEIFKDGEVRVFKYKAKIKTKSQKPLARIFVIPSMINGSEILDMLPERSLVKWLQHQGFEILLLDWGHLRADPELQDFNLALGQKMKKILVGLKHKDDKIPFFGLGYCMGGILLAATEILYKDIFDALCFVATPWDFRGENFSRGAIKKTEKDFTQAVQDWAREGLLKVAALDYMPSEWLQMIFAGVDPDMIVRKFSSFADMKADSFEEKLFVAVEDWVNGGVDLPSGIIQNAVRSWYIENKTMKGEWRVAGRKIKANSIQTPSLVIIPDRDKIVPPTQALPLSDQLQNADILKSDCGHISMMVGTRAETEIWMPMRDWFLRRCSLKNS